VALCMCVCRRVSGLVFCLCVCCSVVYVCIVCVCVCVCVCGNMFVFVLLRLYVHFRVWWECLCVRALVCVDGNEVCLYCGGVCFMFYVCVFECVFGGVYVVFV